MEGGGGGTRYLMCAVLSVVYTNTWFIKCFTNCLCLTPFSDLVCGVSTC